MALIIQLYLHQPLKRQDNFFISTMIGVGYHHSFSFSVLKHTIIETKAGTLYRTLNRAIDVMSPNNDANDIPFNVSQLPLYN